MFGLPLSRIIVIGLVVIAVVGGLGLVFASTRNPLPTKDSGGLPQVPGTVGEKLGGLGDRVAVLEKNLGSIKTLSDQLQDDHKARAKGRLIEVTFKAKSVEKGLASLETDLSAWDNDVAQVMRNEAGRKLASDRARLEQAAAVFERLKQGSIPLAVFKEQSRTFEETLSVAKEKGETGFAPSNAFIADLEKLDTKVRDALRDVAQARSMLRGLLAASNAEVPGPKTLADALRDLEEARQKKRLEEIAALRKSMHDDLTKALLAQEQAEGKRMAEVTMEREKVRLEAERHAKETLLESERSALARKRLEARFEAALPEIKELLKPFLAEAYSQPKEWTFEETGKKGPVSLGAMHRWKWLKKDDVTSLKLLYEAVGSGPKDRPLGRFPALRGIVNEQFPAVQAVVQRAQELLIEFGDLMVEKKMLSP